MCLEVFVVPAIANKVSAERLSDVSGLRVAKHRGQLHLSIDGGCSCSLMSDAADWNAATWDLNPSVLNGIARALQLLSEQAGGFTFQAQWIGDNPETTSRSPLRDVLEDVHNNRIRNKHVYVVGRGAAPRI